MSGRIVLVAGDPAAQDADLVIVAVDGAGTPEGGTRPAAGATRASGAGAAGAGLEPGASVAPPAAGESSGPGRLGVVLAAGGAPPGEETLRAAFRAALAQAAAQGARRVVAGPLGSGLGLSLQQVAEWLLDEAHAALGRHPELEEIRFALPDEPTYRLFEGVEDARRIAAQMARLGLT